MNNCIKAKRTIAILTIVLLVFSHFTNVEAAAKNSVVKPGKPKGIKISINEKNGVKISWKAVRKASKYELYRSIKKGTGYKKVKTLSKCSYMVRNQRAGKKYYYKVRACKIKSGKKIYGKFSAVKSAVLPKTTSTQLSVPSSTPSPAYTPVEDLNKTPVTIPKHMYFTIVKVSGNSIQMSCETNLSSVNYTMKKPDNLNIQEGTHLKVVNPQITSMPGNNGNIEVSGYTDVYVLEEGRWTTIPQYVKEISAGVLYLSCEPSQDVTCILNTKMNEMLVTKDGKYVTVDDIKPGDKLLFYVSTAPTAGVPGTILDCTQISIISE